MNDLVTVTFYFLREQRCKQNLQHKFNDNKPFAVSGECYSARSMLQPVPST